MYFNNKKILLHYFIIISTYVKLYSSIKNKILNSDFYENQSNVVLILLQIAWKNVTLHKLPKK